MDELIAQGSNDEHIIHLRSHPGWIEVIAGSMFSGKSEERVAVGAGGMYEARCRRCFVPHADAPTSYVTETAD